jgi:hypothetical protein
MSWDLQETYLSGMGEDPQVPFTRDTAVAWEQQEIAPGVAGPRSRKADTGAKMLDLTAMISELEADPAARRRI